MADNNEYVELKRLISWVLITMILMTILTIVVGILSESLTIGAIAIDAGASLCLHLFSLISIRIIMRQNSFNFPYGTGKLENFSAFLYAFIVTPGAVFIIISAIGRFIVPPVPIKFGLVQVLMVIWLIRDIPLFLWIKRICRRYPEHSPISQSYKISMKITLISDVAICAGLLLGLWMSSAGYIRISTMIDFVIAIAISVYMLYYSIRLLISNFQSLIDIPLPEKDQYQILTALIADLDSFKNIGKIYSQLSGNTRLIQIEIYVDHTATIEEIDQLRIRIEGRLKQHFHKMLFHLIPLIQENTELN
jgi:cation diffusion facilitator family transporter